MLFLSWALTEIPRQGRSHQMTETPTYFKSFPLKPEILSTIESLGFSVPTPIQNKSLLPLLKGLDVIGQSQTGSGKTLAFALPILQQIDLDNREIQALILGPTRELCAQVTREIRSLGRGLRGLQVLSLVGGEPLRHQKEALSRGAHIAVGTPGRVLDLLERAQVNFKNLKILILDEADRLLDMGFSEQVAGILDALPQISANCTFFCYISRNNSGTKSQVSKKSPKNYN
jgi:ATP-independent RNA helicase DbpA